MFITCQQLILNSESTHFFHLFFCPFSKSQTISKAIWCPQFSQKKNVGIFFITWQYPGIRLWENYGHHKLLSRFTDLYEVEFFDCYQNVQKMQILVFILQKPTFYYACFYPRPYTGGPQIVQILCPQGIVLLQKSYYLGTDLVLKVQFMTFGFPKYHFSHISGLHLMTNYGFFFYLFHIWTIRPW